MHFAGVPHVSDHLVGAAAKNALAWTATVFSAENLAVRVGGASRHGARLFLPLSCLLQWKDPGRVPVVHPANLQVVCMPYLD